MSHLTVNSHNLRQAICLYQWVKRRRRWRSERFLGGFAFPPKKKWRGGMCSPHFIQILNFYTNFEMWERMKKKEKTEMFP